MDKVSDLYNNEIYTVVPKEFDYSKGIFPDDQGFNKRYVLLWDNPKDLLNFGGEWERVKIKFIPAKRKFHITKLGGGFAIPFVSSHNIITKLERF